MTDQEFAAIAAEDDLWDGEMESYELGGQEILLVRLDGEYRAYEGACPHQSTSLALGDLAGSVLTCSAHEWEFDLRTGQGINPRTACLRPYDVRVEDGRVLVRRRPRGAAGRPAGEAGPAWR